MINETITKYGIWSKKNKRLLKWDKTSNQGGYACGEYTYNLEDTDDASLPDWLVDNPKHAEWVRLNSTEWYNSDYDAPNHNTYINQNYSNNKYQVVKVEVTTVITPEPVRMPTMEEYLNKKYADKPDYLKSYMDDLKKHPKFFYSLYDYERIYGERLYGSI